ncbi:MAG: tRNA pseudouridine(38-40) synthase TruA [Candidatus Thermoplasmatota archaeon]|nr:tRNA pseudouridine(38-40) synthase TruA [Candidatus Thermoplasmatota archaeon]
MALKIAYDGRFFHGFARQPQVETVEGTLVDVLIKLKFIPDTKTASFRAASRTDKGVSALGNVIAFNTDKKIKNIQKDCNNDLDNVLVYGIKKVPSDFYPRHAKQRIYRYYLNKNEYEYNLLNSSASLFKGTYDFSNFARVESHKNPVRTIDSIVVYESEDFFVFDFSAQTYLWHQLRRIISAITQFEKQKITTEDIVQALIHPEKQVDFGLASPFFLILTDVIYDCSFKIDKEGLKKKEAFEKQLIHEIKRLSLKNANKTTHRNQQSRQLG